MLIHVLLHAHRCYTELIYYKRPRLRYYYTSAVLELVCVTNTLPYRCDIIHLKRVSLTDYGRLVLTKNLRSETSKTTFTTITWKTFHSEY